MSHRDLSECRLQKVHCFGVHATFPNSLTSRMIQCQEPRSFLPGNLPAKPSLVLADSTTISVLTFIFINCLAYNRPSSLESWFAAGRRVLGVAMINQCQTTDTTKELSQTNLAPLAGLKGGI